MKTQPLTPYLIPTNTLEGALFIDHTGKLIVNPKSIFQFKDCKYQHLYLCDPEAEIKRDNYFICQGRIQKALKVDSGYIYGNDTSEPRNLCLLIVITTDPNLIEDGVVAIDENTKAKKVSDYSSRPDRTLEVNFLAEFCKRYNKKDTKKVDVERLAEKYSNGIQHIQGDKDLETECKEHFTNGYNQALQSTGYSWEDMIAFGRFVDDYYNEERPRVEVEEMLEEFQSVVPSKKEIVVEVEMETPIHAQFVGNNPPSEIRLNENGQPTLILK